MAAPLDPSPDEILQWGETVVRWMADYLGTIRERTLYPATTSAEIRSHFEHEVPENGVPFETLLADFETIVRLSRQNAHPRMFGYVQPPGTALAGFADLLASTLNANLTAWRSAPAPVEVERLTIDWIRQIMGYGPEAGGLFVSGGSMANLTAMVAARRAKAPPEFVRQGASALKQMRLYVSPETHHSVAKAATLLGLGTDNIRTVAVDDEGRMRPDDLAEQVQQDKWAGHLPFFVAATVGTVATGAVDPLGEIHAVARAHDLWMHVDGAYGGFAILAESVRSLFDGIALADSITLDPHKWLYLPVDCGCILFRDRESARQAFAHDAEYTRVLGQEAEEAFAFWDYGPELSRRFRALKVWMTLRGVGLNAIRAAIEKDLACARHLQSLIEASDDFEMLSPVRLSIACFRFLPPGTAGRATLDQFNERLLIEVQREGSSYLSNANVGGAFALRACIMNYRTTLEDMEILLRDIRYAAKKLTA